MDLTGDYRLTSLKRVEKIPVGIDAFVFRLVGRFKSRRSVIWRILRTARKIDSLGRSLSEKSDAELKGRIEGLAALLKRPVNDSTLCEAFALMQEAAFRTMGYRPYVEQIAGALCVPRCAACRVCRAM